MGLYIKGMTKEDLLKILPVLESAVVEVPEPHGRLIDAGECAVYREHYETYNDYSTAFDMIDNAPTVIEAED